MPGLIQSIVISTLLMIMSMSAMAEDGEFLYISKCACCHNDEDTLRIGSSKIKKALTDDSIRAHYFKLSDSDLEILIQYLSEATD